MPETRSTPPPPATSGRLSRRLIGVCAIAGTVIGGLSIIIPVAATWSARTSSTETLEVESDEVVVSGPGPGPGGGGGLSPVQTGLGPQALGAINQSAQSGSLYAIPVDAPWAELWALTDSAADCVSDGQIAWIESHGTEIPAGRLFVQIRSDATSGDEITISEIRAQGELTAPLGDTVTVSYPAGCVGGEPWGVYAHLSIGVDPVAIFDECYAVDDSCYSPEATRPQPGDPVVLTVRPGETRVMHLYYDYDVDFVGRIVATVTAAGQSATLDLSPGGMDIVAPAVTRPDLFLVVESAGPFCTDDFASGSGTRACTLEQWLGMMAG